MVAKVTGINTEPLPSTEIRNTRPHNQATHVTTSVLWPPPWGTVTCSGIPAPHGSRLNLDLQRQY